MSMDAQVRASAEATFFFFALGFLSKFFLMDVTASTIITIKDP